MALPFVDREEGRVNAKRVAEALKYLPLNTEYDFFGRAAEKCGRDRSNDLQDPFEEDGEELDSSIVAHRNKRRLSKIDTAISLMAGFSPEFQQAVQETRLEMGLPESANICAEDLSQFRVKPLVIERDEEFLKKLDTLRKTVDYDSYRHMRDDPSRLGPGEKKEKYQLRQDSRQAQLLGMGSTPSASSLTHGLEVIDSNSMSGFWRMMEGQPMTNGFPVTENGYNIYEDKRIDWLRREGLPWSDNEKIRNKCESWINNTTDNVPK